MADNNNNRDIESFALGMIVLAILYFVFLRKAGKGCGCGSGTAALPKAKSGCTSVMQLTSANPGVSLGGQSYSGSGAFGESSVVS